MNDKLKNFLDNYTKHYNEVPHYMEPQNEICIIINCCSSKSNDISKIPAYSRYLGDDFKMINHLKFTKNMKLDYYILSAQYGLIPYSAPIEKYNVTFNDLSNSELKELAPYLHIREDLDKILDNYKQVYLLLGDKYRKTLNIEKPFNTKSELIYFELEKNIGTINEIKSLNKHPIKFSKDLVKIFKKYILINIKMAIIMELFLKYPNYEFLEDSSIIEKFIEDKKNTKPNTLF